jgi:hypothetical protein
MSFLAVAHEATTNKVLLNGEAAMHFGHYMIKRWRTA